MNSTPPRKRHLLLKILTGLALVGGAVAVGIAFTIGQAAKAGIEYFGPRVLGVPVTVRAVALSPFLGRGAILGLKIGNPKGYSGDALMKVDAVTIELELGSLGGNPLRLAGVTIRKPEVTWEGTLLGESNLSRVQDQVSHYAGKSASQDRRFVIGKLKVEGAKAIVRLGSMDAPVTLRLPDIELNDVGEGKGGATAKEVVALLLNRVSASVVAAISSTPEVVGGPGARLMKGVKSLFGK